MRLRSVILLVRITVVMVLWLALTHLDMRPFGSSALNLFLTQCGSLVPQAGAAQKSVKDTSCTLETIWGGRHGRHPAIVFQFSKKVPLPNFRIQGHDIRLQLDNVTTGLPSLRKYKTFDSRVLLEKSGNNLKIHIKIPENYSRHHMFMLQNPWRLLVYFLNNSPDTNPENLSPAATRAQSSHMAIHSGAAEGKEEADAAAVRTATGPPDQSQPFIDDEKQMGLIEARILSRLGLYHPALQAYHRLRARYPQDEEVWADYIETLVNHADYDDAQAELAQLFRDIPASLRGRRLQARIYHELQRFRWTYPIYESLLRQYRTDAGIWSDYASARQDAQEWSAALNYYCRVLELDPENQDALRSVHAILKTHRPRLESGWRTTTQEAGDVRIDSYHVHYTGHLSRRTVLDLGYKNIVLRRPAAAAVSAIDQDVNDMTMRLRHWFDRRWQARAGVGGYSGLGGGSSFLLGVDCTAQTNAHLHADYAAQRPWYDPVEAASQDGYFNRGALSFDWNIDPAWGLLVGTAHYDYYVNDDIQYGQKHTIRGTLFRKISERPDVSLSYSYYRSRFSYENAAFTPIEMLEKESVHGLSLYLEHRFCTYWSFSFSGGFQRDTDRSTTSWFVVPGIRFRLGNRIELNADYEYSSEAGTVEGGATETLRIRSTIIF